MKLATQLYDLEELPGKTKGTVILCIKIITNKSMLVMCCIFPYMEGLY
jgi:hypothetical protein